MDPLSIIASVFSIYQVASHLTGQLFRYARGIKHAEAEANTFLGEIRHFQGALEELSSLLQDEADTTGTSDRLKAIRDITSHDSLLLKNCKTDLEELERRLDEDEITQGGLKGQAKALLNKLKWPLKEEEIRKIIDNMRTVSAQIQKAQTMDTMRMVRAIDSTTKEINETTKATEQAVAFVKTAIVDAEAKQAAGEAKKKAEDKQKVWEETREKFVEWLVYPDPGENHNIACKAKNPAANTGEWFLDGDDFKRFKESDRALLWLDGNPGCGKTVLSSSIIENLVGELESNEQSAMAYWYFSSSGKATMSLDNCIRSLITQFMMAVSGKFPKAIDELWNNKGRKKETPKLSDLTYTLHSHLQEEKVKFYIIIDALDEAREEDHEDLLRFVQDLISNDMHGIGLVLTSRPFVKEKFKERFEDEANFFDIAIERASVDGDIKSHIQEQLTTDPNLSQWKEEVRNSILSALLEKAEGM